MKLPFDDSRRIRLYLLRHGEAAASAGGGDVYGDAIVLTPTGCDEAAAMGAFLAPVAFDAALCSPIARARQTAQIALEGRDLPLVEDDRFREIEGDYASVLRAQGSDAALQGTFAYNMWTAGDADARFFGGDLYAEFVARTGASLEALVREAPGSVVLVVTHSGFLRAALTWALDAGPRAMAAFEQDSCCLNVLDIDLDPAGTIVRKHVRLANFTPRDPAKAEGRLTNGEAMAQRLFAHTRTHR